MGLLDRFRTRAAQLRCPPRIVPTPEAARSVVHARKQAQRIDRALAEWHRLEHDVLAK